MSASIPRAFMVIPQDGRAPNVVSVSSLGSSAKGSEFREGQSPSPSAIDDIMENARLNIILLQMKGLPAVEQTPILLALAVKFLQQRFPWLGNNVLQAITTHQIDPACLYQLDKRYQERMTPHTGTIILLENPLFSLVALQRPLLLYFRIVGSLVKLSRDAATALQFSLDTAKYMKHLQELNNQYRWEAVARYHVAYQQARLAEMARGDYAGWGPVDQELAATILIGNEKAQAPMVQSSIDVTSNSRGSARINHNTDGRPHQGPAYSRGSSQRGRAVAPRQRGRANRRQKGNTKGRGGMERKEETKENGETEGKEETMHKEETQSRPVIRSFYARSI